MKKQLLLTLISCIASLSFQDMRGLVTEKPLARATRYTRNGALVLCGAAIVTHIAERALKERKTPLDQKQIAQLKKIQSILLSLKKWSTRSALCAGTGFSLLWIAGKILAQKEAYASSPEIAQGAGEAKLVSLTPDTQRKTLTLTPLTNVPPAEPAGNANPMSREVSEERIALEDELTHSFPLPDALVNLTDNVTAEIPVRQETKKEQRERGRLIVLLKKHCADYLESNARSLTESETLVTAELQAAISGKQASEANVTALEALVSQLENKQLSAQKIEQFASLYVVNTRGVRDSYTRAENEQQTWLYGKPGEKKSRAYIDQQIAKTTKAIQSLNTDFTDTFNKVQQARFTVQEIEEKHLPALIARVAAQDAADEAELAKISETLDRNTTLPLDEVRILRQENAATFTKNKSLRALKIAQLQAQLNDEREGLNVCEDTHRFISETRNTRQTELASLKQTLNETPTRLAQEVQTTKKAYEEMLDQARLKKLEEEKGNLKKAKTTLSGYEQQVIKAQDTLKLIATKKANVDAQQKELTDTLTELQKRNALTAELTERAHALITTDRGRLDMPVRGMPLRGDGFMR